MVELRCFYCGIMLDLDIQHIQCPNALTKDHMMPKIRGGRSLGVGNIVYCCRLCNSRKGRKTVEEYREYLIGQTPIGCVHQTLEKLINEPLLNLADKTVLCEACKHLSPRPTIVFYGERESVDKNVNRGQMWTRNQVEEPTWI